MQAKNVSMGKVKVKERTEKVVITWIQDKKVKVMWRKSILTTMARERSFQIRSKTWTCISMWSRPITWRTT